MAKRDLNFDPEEGIDFMNIDETDYGAMPLGEKMRHLEVEGYVVLPGVLDPDHMDRIKEEMADAPMGTKDYSDCQTYHREPQWYSPALAEVIANPPVVEFLEALCGEEIVFTRGLFTRTLAGSPPISLHTDGQPFGSSIFGYEGSSPKLLRVLFYLDDLTPERAPLRVLPRSHLSFHADANPYVRYKSHPGEVTICAQAGTAVVFPVNIFHGTHPNMLRLACAPWCSSGTARHGPARSSRWRSGTPSWSPPPRPWRGASCRAPIPPGSTGSSPTSRWG